MSLNRFRTLTVKTCQNVATCRNAFVNDRAFGGLRRGVCAAPCLHHLYCFSFVLQWFCCFLLVFSSFFRGLRRYLRRIYIYVTSVLVLGGLRRHLRRLYLSCFALFACAATCAAYIYAIFYGLRRGLRRGAFFTRVLYFLLVCVVLHKIVGKCRPNVDRPARPGGSRRERQTAPGLRRSLFLGSDTTSKQIHYNQLKTCNSSIGVCACVCVCVSE